MSISFVGRQRECELLRQEFETALGARTRVVMIAGDPGIGKSRLMSELARHALDQGAEVLHGGASEAEGMPPYLPLLEALGHHVRTSDSNRLRGEVGVAAMTLSTILPELVVRLGELPAGYPLPPEQARLRLFEAVGSFLTAIAASTPLVVLLDDLQWADSSTFELLCHVTRHQAAARMLIVGAYREAEAEQNGALQRALAELARQRILTRISLAPLSPEETDQLAAGVLEQPTDATVDRVLYTQSEGNPFFAEELLRGWLEMGALVSEKGRWSLSVPPDQALPASIVSAVRDRLSRLKGDTVDLLRVAAIVGRRFEASLLVRLAGEDVEVVEERLVEAVKAGLLEAENEDFYRFSHDKIRECLYLEVSGARRRRLHQAIGQELERDDSQGAAQRLAELSFHFVRSGDSEKGTFYSLQAADQARQSFAADEAMSHYQSALSLLGTHDVRRGNLLLQLGEVALLAGKEHEAAAVFEEAHGLLLAGNDPVAPARAAHGLGVARWRQGALPEAQIALEAAITLLGELEGPDTVRIMVDLASLLNSGAGQQAKGMVYGGRALELARRIGDKRLEAASCRVVGQLTFWGNDFPNGIQLLERALVLAQAADDPAEAAEICGVLSNACFAVIDIERSRQMTLMRMDFARRCHQPYELRHVHAWLAEIALQQGDWSRLEQLIEQAQQVVNRLVGDEPVAVLHRIRGLLAQYRGQNVEAEQWLEKAVAIVRSKGPQHLAWYLGPLGLTYLALGKKREARTCLIELESVVAELPAGSLPTAPALTALVELAVQMGALDLAAPYAEQLRGSQGRMYLSLVDTALAAFESARGSWPAAEAYLTRAENDARRAGLRPSLLRILEDHATLCMVRGGAERTAQALQWLGEALDLAGELRLDSKAAEIRARMQSLSSRKSLPAGLSRREVEVLQRVAAGKSNREIAEELVLREKTVENHLTSIFNKTSTPNRAAATAFAIRHGLA